MDVLVSTFPRLKLSSLHTTLQAKFNKLIVNTGLSRNNKIINDNNTGFWTFFLYMWSTKLYKLSSRIKRLIKKFLSLERASWSKFRAKKRAKYTAVELA